MRRMETSPAYVAMAMLAGWTVDEALASLAAPPTDAETLRHVASLRAPDRALRAQALAVGVASVVRAVEALDALAVPTVAPTPPPLAPTSHRGRRA